MSAHIIIEAHNHALTLSTPRLPQLDEMLKGGWYTDTENHDVSVPDIDNEPDCLLR